MSEVIDLSPTDTDRRLQTPPLQGRGKGWGLSAERLAALKQRARDMRNNPTEPEKRLWRHLSNGQLHGHKFRRQQVIGNHIADFACPRARLVVEVDGDTHEEAKDQRRDEALLGFGYRVLRFTNDEVMANMDGVLAAISEAAKIEAIGESPHPNPSPEGEGLSSSRTVK